MIKRFKFSIYLEHLCFLAGTRAVELLKSCIADGLEGFEASSRSVSIYCQSVKMGLAMKVGSKLEKGGKLTFEHAAEVAGFYFKVGEVGITFLDENKKPCGVRYRPDALRLFTLPAEPPSGGFKVSDFLRFAEFKNWEELGTLSSRSDRYVFNDATGRYHSPAAERAALETYGFGYDVLTERDFDPVIVANVEYLDAYFRDSVPQVPAAVATRAQEVVSVEQGITLPGLLAVVEGLTVDRFCKLLVDQKLYVPLNACQLDLPGNVQVFSDRLTCDALLGLLPPKDQPRLTVRRFPRFEPEEIITIRGKNHTVVIAGADSVQFRTDKGDSTVVTRQELEALLKQKQISSLGVPVNNADRAKKILLSTPPHRLNAALERLAIIDPVLRGKMRSKEARARMPNFTNWLSRGREALQEFGSAIIGLIDGRDRQGQHGSHLSTTAEAIVEEVITAHYASDRAPKKCSAYAKYRNVCKERGATPVSEKTFGKRIRRYAADFLAQKRAGGFAAAAAAAPVDHETLLMGGGRWWMHVGHLDESKIDLATVFPELGLPLGTAWVVVMIDSYTRTILAVIATFESPSYLTTMVLLRECAARWGRLPEILFMDNGPGFKNASLVLFAKYYGTELDWRPKGKARWGADVERFIGDFLQRVANELPGATKILNRLRRVSKSHHPDKLAVFGLQAVAEITREWCYTVFDNLPHGGLHGKTPAEARAVSQAEHGRRWHLNISCDPLFPILSLPAPEGDGTAKVQAHDGVQVDNLYYWHKRFYDSEVVGTRVQVRFDPFDITKVYAFVRDEWVQCDCIKLLRLRRLSAEDLCVASLEIRRGRSTYNKRRNEILEQVDAFLDAQSKKGEELAELLRTRESARQFLARITPPKFSDDEDGAAPAATAPTTPPRIPGFTDAV